MNKRFKDNGELTSYFDDHIIIECPDCKSPIDYFNLKIVCVNCGFNKEFKTPKNRFDFEVITIPLVRYLSIKSCGEVLSANNLDHLEFLEEYVSANLRERMPNVNKSLISRLPQWIKSKKNREDILKDIGKLKERLSENHYSSRFKKYIA
ncbi:hypothetical protein [uncultured Psychroserpens sp.]|uniref:hypothetical protein n=1 Tax=uncultured Psychroserpens sp. TaxID=255436 RepID=UPI00262F58DF|nr:hypothetical protein [uncultured Psychroserpens sp.]